METRFRFINMLIVRLLIIPMILVSASFSDAISKDLNVSLAFLPKILESPNEGVFVDLVKAIDEVYDVRS